MMAYTTISRIFLAFLAQRFETANQSAEELRIRIIAEFKESGLLRCRNVSEHAERSLRISYHCFAQR